MGADPNNFLFCCGEVVNKLKREKSIVCIIHFCCSTAFVRDYSFKNELTGGAVEEML
jgi:hypothetical protein